MVISIVFDHFLPPCHYLNKKVIIQRIKFKEKSYTPTITLALWKLCRNGDRGQRASFGSFRIAVILRLWATILNVESDVCMVNNRMILFTKRLRSKAPSAAPLSPVQFANRRGLGLYFLPTIYYDTVS